ncbi:MAG: adenylate/guanylate cyclase domain-containing protein, partial [Pseudomonadales bacterium]
MSSENSNLFQHLRQILAAGVDPLDREDEIWAAYGQRVSVMVLDSTGFSRVTEQHGILHFLSRLVLLRDIVKPVLVANNCLQSKFEADDAFAIFESPDDAIKAAFAVHHQVENEKLMLTENEPFSVCVGIGYGDMLYSETLEGYFGEEMNLASKLGEDTADGGETLITQNAFSAASHQLLTDFEPRQIHVSGLDV